jgi:tetratricopeptide (TPR) repeat protein
MRVACLFALLLPVAAWAEGPPPLDALFAELRQADSPEEASPIEEQILLRFRRSGSPSVDLLMARAEAASAAGDKQTARKLYDAVTEIAPAFAEGWHMLAVLQSESGDDQGAMVSLQRTIALNPRQFAAMAELGRMLEDYGDKPGALKIFRRALILDPQYQGLARHVGALAREIEGQGI